jgi:hypothetical protein
MPYVNFCSTLADFGVVVPKIPRIFAFSLGYFGPSLLEFYEKEWWGGGSSPPEKLLETNIHIAST